MWREDLEVEWLEETPKVINHMFGWKKKLKLVVHKRQEKLNDFCWEIDAARRLCSCVCACEVSGHEHLHRFDSGVQRKSFLSSERDGGTCY